MRRGEVWWSAPSLAGSGRKRRPFVIVSHDAFNGNERYTKVLVVHVTSVQRLGGPFDWEVVATRTVSLSNASLPLEELIAMEPIASAVGRFAVPPAPCASWMRKKP